MEKILCLVIKQIDDKGRLMLEKKILLIGGVSLTKGRIKDVGLVMKEICDELEPMLNKICFINSAPFEL